MILRVILWVILRGSETRAEKALGFEHFLMRLPRDRETAIMSL